MPKSPLNELMDWTEEDFLNRQISDYEIMIVHVLSALSKIYNRKISILSQKTQGKIEYLVFEIDEDINIDHQLFDKWHSHYIRKARLFR